MNSAVIVSICLSTALFALGLSAVSLVLHWVRRHESPEYSALSQRIESVQTSHLDLLDKVEHWRRRDNVRNARAGAEAKSDAAAAEPATVSPAAYKQQLRDRALANGLGIPTR